MVRTGTLALLVCSLSLPGSAAAAAIEAAQAAFFEAKFDEAEAILQKAAEAETKSGVITADRAKIHLLRSAIAFKQGRSALAEQEALAAVMLDPELRAETFSASVQEMLEDARQKLPPRVVVRIATNPASAEARVDGRSVVGGVIAVVPGSHQLIARANGYQPLVKNFDVGSGTTLTVDLVKESVAARPAAPTPAPSPTAVAKAAPVQTSIPRSTPRPPSGALGGRSNLAAYSLLGAAAVSAGVGGHGFVSKGISERNRAGAPPDQRRVYDDEIARFNLQSIGGAGLAILSAGAATWMLVGKRGSGAWLEPRPGGALVGFSIELGSPRITHEERR